MTDAQNKAIENLKERFLGFYGHPEDKEIKYFDADECCDGSLIVTIEVGRIGDEGTLAECTCRKTLIVLISKRGSYFKHIGKTRIKKFYYKTTTEVICNCQI